MGTNQKKTNQKETKHNVVCPGCTCLCDDIEISIDNNLLVAANNTCCRGLEWFQQPAGENAYWVDGQAVAWNAAMEAGCQSIAESNAPLVCGIENLSTVAQQSAWRLADRIGATIDTSLADGNRGSMFALQRVGKVTATLGEIASRSDLVVFWFSDPVSTHPRHLERYARPAGAPPRQMIVVDDHETETAKVADTFIQLERQSAAAALAQIRANIVGVEREIGFLTADRGGPNQRNPALDCLSERLVNSTYGVLFYGHTAEDSQFDLATESIARLVRELNQKTRFVSLAMRDDANGQSAENVLSWSSGFPFATNLQQNFPRSNWLEYSAATILRRQECDLILLGSTYGLPARLEHLNPVARKHFEQTPKIVLSETGNINIPNTKVQFLVAQPGVSTAGDYCRLDDVSLPLSNVRSTTELIVAEKVFERLGSR